MRRISFFLLLSICGFTVYGTESAKKNPERRSIKDIVQNEDFEDKDSIWESRPIKIQSAKMQILDKISGKVFRQTVAVNKPIVFGTIELQLKKCFENSPEDNKEVYAFVEIKEKGEVIFSNWLFTSSPSVNLLTHSVYDIRVEF
jgi:hypothetical protein